MDSALLSVAARLLGERRAYALATVVRRERPSSASSGNTAVITSDGQVHGWIGGSCTQPEVVRHARAALADGRPRLLGFGASAGERDGLVPVPMSCGSEGKVEVHVNPVFPAPQLVVAGSSPVADAVARLGRAMGYPVACATADDLGAAAAEWAGRAPGAKLFAVVATMGRWDEQAVQRLVAAKPDYLGVVVSPKRMRRVRRVLVEAGVSDEEVARVRGPAGLDIGAESPEEVAVSILAEIVAAGAGRERADDAAGPGRAACRVVAGAPEAVRAVDETAPAGEPEQATDPVCGMTVPADGSRPSSAYEGRTVYFCCPGCRARFDADPSAYA